MQFATIIMPAANLAVCIIVYDISLVSRITYHSLGKIQLYKIFIAGMTPQKLNAPNIFNSE